MKSKERSGSNRYMDLILLACRSDHPFPSLCLDMVVVLNRPINKKRSFSRAVRAGGVVIRRRPSPPSVLVPRPVAPPTDRRHHYQRFFDVAGSMILLDRSALRDPIDPHRTGYFHRLAELFSRPDEIWNDQNDRTFRYLKFHNEYLLVAVVEADRSQMKIRDWFALDYALLPHERPCGLSIPDQRAGKLIHSSAGSLYMT